VCPDKERSKAIPLVRPIPIPHLHDWRKMEVCLKFCTEYSEMECKCVRKFTEGLFRKYNTI
jgi:hypothetical protein